MVSISLPKLVALSPDVSTAHFATDQFAIFDDDNAVNFNLLADWTSITGLLRCGTNNAPITALGLHQEFLLRAMANRASPVYK